MIPRICRAGLARAIPFQSIRGLSTGPVTVHVKITEDDLSWAYRDTVRRADDAAQKILLRGFFAVPVPNACLFALPPESLPASAFFPLFFGSWALFAAPQIMKLLQIRTEARRKALSDGNVAISGKLNVLIDQILRGAKPTVQLGLSGMEISGPLNKESK